MKSIIIASMAVIFSCSAFSQTIGKSTSASRNDRRILCESIEKQLELDASDEAVDLAKCLKTKMTSRLVSEGILEVKGQVAFNSPSRSYKRSCSVSYYALTEELVAEPACVH